MQKQREENAMLSNKTRIIRALIGLAIMIAKAVVWQLVGAGRTSALYRGRHGILPRLLLFKPLFAKALNFSRFYSRGLKFNLKFESTLLFLYKFKFSFYKPRSLRRKFSRPHLQI